MNKAFVREPELLGPEPCPACGSLGVPVGRRTLESLLRPEAATQLGETANFCPLPRCEVAYFDVMERVVPVTGLRAPVYPKDPSAALCPCFGLTPDDVELDLAEGGVRRVKEALARAQSSEARCAECSPTGRPCVAEVQRYYMKRRQG